MKNNNNHLKSLLEYLFKEAPEASSDSVYGKYLFAPDRTDLKPNEKEELNEPIEDDLRDALRNWYGGGGAGGLEDQIDWIMTAIESGEYKKILAPPKNTKVYRWLCNLHVDTASDILQTDPLNIIQKNGMPGIVNVQNNLNPKYSYFQSWTTDLNKFISIVPNDLGDINLHKDKVAIILESNTKLGNFLLNPKGIKNVKNLPHYAYKQDEIISYQEVHITRASFFYSEDGTATKNFIPDLINLLTKK